MSIPGVTGVQGARRALLRRGGHGRREPGAGQRRRLRRHPRPSTARSRVGFVHNMADWRPANPASAADERGAQHADYILNRAVPRTPSIRGVVRQRRRRQGRPRRAPAAACAQGRLHRRELLLARVRDRRSRAPVSTRVPLFDFAPHDRLPRAPATPTGPPCPRRCTDFGWEIDPDGLRNVLSLAASYGRPLYVTENGIDDADDSERPDVPVEPPARGARGPSPTGPTCAATSTGRWSTTSSGPRATTPASGCTLRPADRSRAAPVRAPRLYAADRRRRTRCRPGDRATRPSRRAAVVIVALAALPAPAFADVRITRERVVVDAGEAQAVVGRAPFRLAFRDGRGRTVLTEVPNRRPAPWPSRRPSTPSRSAWTTSPRPRSTRRSRSPSAASSSPRTRGPVPDRGDPAQRRGSGVQYAAPDGRRRAAQGRRGRLVVATSDPSGRRLVVTCARSAPGTRCASACGRLRQTGSRRWPIRSRRRPARRSAGSAAATTTSTSAATTSTTGCSRRTSAPAPASADPENDRFLFPNGPTAAYYVQCSFVSSRRIRLPARPRRALALADGLRPRRRLAGRGRHAGLDYIVVPGRPKPAIRDADRV